MNGKSDKRFGKRWFTILLILVFFKVYAEELKGGNEVVQLTFRATNLDKKVQKCSIMLFQ